MRVTSCPTLGGACPATCVRPRFPHPVSYLAHEIHFDTLTHAPRVATEVGGLCLTFGKGTKSRSAAVLLSRLLSLVLKRPQPEADHLCGESWSCLTTLSSADIIYNVCDM